MTFDCEKILGTSEYRFNHQMNLRKIMNAANQQTKRQYFSYQFKENLAIVESLAASGGFSSALSLEIGSLPKTDLSFIGGLKELQNLSLLGLSSATVNLSSLEMLRSLELHEKAMRSVSGIESLNLLEKVVLHSPTSAQLEAYGGQGRSLVIYGAPAVIPRLTHSNRLKEVKIVGSKNGAVDLSGLSSAANLEYLSLNDLQNGVTQAGSLAKLQKLKHLMFWNVGHIDSKEWILTLPELQNVTVWGVNDFAEVELQNYRLKGLAN